MLGAFRAFGKRADAEFLRHVDDGRDNLLRLFRERREEPHVELDEIDIEILQRMERRILAAEVVKPDLVARFAELVDGALELRRSINERFLAELDADEVALEVGIRKRPLEKAERVLAQEILPREVDGNRHDRLFLRDALFEHAADLAQHGAIELVETPFALEYGQETVRRHNALFFVLPADEGLHAADLFGQCTDNRLIINLDMPLLNCFFQVFQEICIFLNHYAIPASHKVLQFFFSLPASQFPAFSLFFMEFFFISQRC